MKEFVILTNYNLMRWAHVVMFGPVNHNTGIVFSGMVHLAVALVNPSGEFLLLVIMSRLNSSTVPSLWCPLCMCGPLSVRGDTTVRSSLAGNLWTGQREQSPLYAVHITTKTCHVTVY